MHIADHSTRSRPPGKIVEAHEDVPKRQVGDESLWEIVAGIDS